MTVAITPSDDCINVAVGKLGVVCTFGPETGGVKASPKGRDLGYQTVDVRVRVYSRRA